MTDPRLEAAARAMWQKQGVLGGVDLGMERWADLARAALAAADAAVEPEVEDAREAAQRMIDALDRERLAAGVDEWDEDDPRCAIYNAAYAIIERHPARSNPDAALWRQAAIDLHSRDHSGPFDACLMSACETKHAALARLSAGASAETPEGEKPSVRKPTGPRAPVCDLCLEIPCECNYCLNPDVYPDGPPAAVPAGEAVNFRDKAWWVPYGVHGFEGYGGKQMVPLAVAEAAAGVVKLSPRELAFQLLSLPVTTRRKIAAEIMPASAGVAEDAREEASMARERERGSLLAEAETARLAEELAEALEWIAEYDERDGRRTDDPSEAKSCIARAVLARYRDAGERRGKRITHGRHCICSACAAQDWSEPQLAPCGMHGKGCPGIYAPLGAVGEYEPAGESSEAGTDR